ncbi:hypothetical protein [Sphingobium aromaticiconvertens]|uniref:hypothetical protein n=1 Tax=Sphingobium aromaticiconvertens TaxID=365341 RepID=UPI0030198627
MIASPSFRALLGAACFAMFACPVQASEHYPDVPEPMIFDMMRPLGAKRGELEVNTLAATALSGSDRAIYWAPEIEYAFADGFAIEGELPFEDGRLAELKLGLQAAFGTMNGGRTAHGVQYLGIYDRHAGHYRNSVAYMLVNRANARWSSVSMVGLADIGFGGGEGRNALILNHSTFYDASQKQILGVEVNYLGGDHGSTLVMPQLHQKLSSHINVQLGLGAEKEGGSPIRPRAGLRLIREL